MLIAVYAVGAMCERRVSLIALIPAAAVVAVLSASTADVEGRTALGISLLATSVRASWRCHLAKMRALASSRRS